MDRENGGGIATVGEGRRADDPGDLVGFSDARSGHEHHRADRLLTRILTPAGNRLLFDLKQETPSCLRRDWKSHCCGGRTMRYNRTVLMPVPVVVDANVLIRNVEYPIRTGRTGAMFGHASAHYSLMSGIVLFAAAEVREEALRHLPEVAERQGVSLDRVRAIWNELIVPRVRFVALRDVSCLRT